MKSCLRIRPRKPIADRRADGPLRVMKSCLRIRPRKPIADRRADGPLRVSVSGASSDLFLVLVI